MKQFQDIAWRRLVIGWLPLAFGILVALGTSYGFAQQSLRLAANEIPLQLASDTARAMTLGQPSSSVLESGNVDLGNSLAPFIIVYDANGKATAGNGKLGGQYVAPPTGVFQYAKAHGDDRLTWQPDNNVRIAAVVVPVGPGGSGGYVLAGRNLSEVEHRIDHLTQLLVWAIIIGLIGSFGLYLAGDQLLASRPTKK